MSKITLQDVFNVGWQKFVVEEHPFCVNDAGECLYQRFDKRGNEQRCVFGWCFTDEQLSQMAVHCVLINTPISGVIEEFPEWFDGDTFLFSRAQVKLHDGLRGRFRTEIEQEYREFAEKYGLTIPS